MHAPQYTPHDPLAPSTPHSYGTRIRRNISLKPSARLRSLPDPTPAQFRKYKPAHRAVPSNAHPYFPQFPLPGIVLHPDDANSKVLMAIGRSFLSVVRNSLPDHVKFHPLNHFAG